MRNIAYSIVRLFLALVLVLVPLGNSLADDPPPIIPETTHVLSAATTDHLVSISADGSTYTFDQSTPELAALAVGDIMVANVSPHAPNGFLRRVQAITHDGAQVLIDTGRAALTEAIERGGVQFSQSLSPNRVRHAQQLPGVSLSPTRSSDATIFKVTLDHVILLDLDGDHSTTNDQVEVNGGIQVNATPEFEIQIDGFTLKSLRFVVNANEDADLALEARLDHDVKKDVLIARYDLTPIVLFIGIVPVVVNPVLAIYVGLDGNVHANLFTSITQNATATLGVEYADNVWSPVGEYTFGYDYTPPALTWGLLLKAYAGPRFSILLYGTEDISAYAQVRSYLLLKSISNQTPWWELFGGLDGTAHVQVTVLGQQLVNRDFALFDVQVKLAESQTAAPALENLFMPIGVRVGP